MVLQFPLALLKTVPVGRSGGTPAAEKKRTQGTHPSHANIWPLHSLNQFDAKCFLYGGRSAAAPDAPAGQTQC